MVTKTIAPETSAVSSGGRFTPRKGQQKLLEEARAPQRPIIPHLQRAVAWRACSRPVVRVNHPSGQRSADRPAHPDLRRHARGLGPRRRRRGRLQRQRPLPQAAAGASDYSRYRSDPSTC
eukprot:7245163-Pyramimonas_sp.AAC.1